MSLSDLALNPALDRAALAAAYQRDKFVQIPGIFAPDLAQEIGALLRGAIPWHLIYADPQAGVQQLSQDEIARLGPAEMQRRMAMVLQLATRNYGYCYNGYQMTQARRAGRDADHAIHKITDFLNSRVFLDFGAEIIGEQPITQVDAQATLFTKGSFLTRHIDDGSNNERRAAYTLSFCQNWQTDWGGLLQFINKQTTDVTSAWVPRWNTLTLFDGRMVHAVSPVSSFAGDGRYSIVGWFRNDPQQ